MKNFVSYKNWINEKFNYDDYDPMDGTFGTKIDGVDIEAKVGDLIKFSEDYPIEKIDMSKLLKQGLWNKEKFKTQGKVNIDGKWIEYKNLTDEQKKDFNEEVDTTIMKANLKYPIIVSRSEKGKITILDGNHRVEKAGKLGKKDISAHVIPEEDVLKKFKK